MIQSPDLKMYMPNPVLKRSICPQKGEFLPKGKGFSNILKTEIRVGQDMPCLGRHETH